MTKFHSTPPDAVLVAIDMSKHRQEVLLERPEGGRRRLELPLGKVLYETAGAISTPRFSPDGQRVAFKRLTKWVALNPLLPVIRAVFIVSRTGHHFCKDRKRPSASHLTLLWHGH